MNSSIGERIRIRRKDLNITQTQIQNATGISSGNLSGIETGRSLPSASALIELSKILNCSVDWILTGNDYKRETPYLEEFNSFSSKLTYLRENKNLNKKDIAEAVSVHPSSIGNLEKGSIPQADLLYKIAKFFNVSMDYFMDETIAETDIIPLKQIEQTQFIIDLHPTNDNVRNMGERIKTLRKEKNLTQQELGDIVGLHSASIGRIENGQIVPYSDIIFKLSAYFNVSCDYIIVGNGNVKSNNMINATNTEIPFRLKNIIKQMEQLTESELVEFEELIAFKLHRKRTVKSSNSKNNNDSSMGIA